jgi:hypothetical protein
LLGRCEFVVGEGTPTVHVVELLQLLGDGGIVLG